MNYMKTSMIDLYKIATEEPFLEYSEKYNTDFVISVLEIVKDNSKDIAYEEGVSEEKAFEDLIWNYKQNPYLINDLIKSVWRKIMW